MFIAQKNHHFVMCDREEKWGLKKDRGFKETSIKVKTEKTMAGDLYAMHTPLMADLDSTQSQPLLMFLSP